MLDPLEITVADLEEDRYSRLRLIPWWDQSKLKNTKVMVVGAGALGNEVIKNLALVGVGNILIIDMDIIENSNLSRSVLFRAEDCGRLKAEVAAERAMEINPDINVTWMNADIVNDVGLGVFACMDVVIGGLDNREARLAINQSCWKVNVPWVDGAIEVLHGVARVFVPPDGACYECTMGEVDYRILNARRSCTLLSKEEMISGKVPTTPTIASIIAGVQVQEVLKLLHQRDNLPPISGRGFVFNGLNFDCYLIEYQRKDECPSHTTYQELTAIDGDSCSTTLRDLLNRAVKDLGPGSQIDLEHQLIAALECPECETKENICKPLGRMSRTEILCPACGQERMPELVYSLDGSPGEEHILDMTVRDAGLPLYDVFTARNGWSMTHYVLKGGLPLVFQNSETCR
ncbi:MAG TPA: ThiF family adenylyltransferase [Bacillota bacterium]|nr:ThiF family adenylyltransferase [Bacillota bacterium]